LFAWEFFGKIKRNLYGKVKGTIDGGSLVVKGKLKIPLATVRIHGRLGFPGKGPGNVVPSTRHPIIIR
jgi:hypothetical protein